MKKALFPGSFDPLTLGHYDIILRASRLFDRVVVALGINSSKKRYFTIEERMAMLHAAFDTYENIEVTKYDNLTVEFCRQNEIHFIVRGIRNVSDFEYERSLAVANRTMYPEIETIYIDSKPEYLPISSTIVRDIHRNGGDISPFVPSQVLDVIQKIRKA